MPVAFRVYSNGGRGGPVDYTTPVASVSGLSYAAGPLASGDWRFAVRAYDTATGFEERNADAVARVVVASDGSDVTLAPRPVTGLTCRPKGVGSVAVSWTCDPQYRNGEPEPASFNVYCGTGAFYPSPGGTRAPGPYFAPSYFAPSYFAPSYSPGDTAIFAAAAGSVRYARGLVRYRYTLTGLAPGVTVGVLVRARNAAGEDRGADPRSVTPDAADAGRPEPAPPAAYTGGVPGGTPPTVVARP